MSIVTTLRTRLWLAACDQVGLRPALDGKPWIQNRGRLTIGDDLRLCSSPVQSHLDVASGAVLSIGSRVSIGSGAALAAHRSIEIGDEVRIGAYAMIADTDFHVSGLRDATPERTPVVIGRGAVLGDRVTILRGAVVGAGARVLSGSVVSGSIPAGAEVSGVPARPVPSAQGAAVQGTIERRVLASVQRALGLAAPPSPQDGPDQLEQWSSLGTLQLLLALEDDFGLSLREEQVANARAVADLISLVEAMHDAAGTC